MTALAIMGGCVVDLRQAEIEGPVIDISAIAIMGGVEVIVPEGIAVELSGVAIMGGKDCRVKDVTPFPGTPLVRVKAFALWGGVTVRTKRERPRTPTASKGATNAGSRTPSAIMRHGRAPRRPGAWSGPRATRRWSKRCSARSTRE